ncbi:hypothetical protein B9N43_09115 [Denitratisoma sp. DHT3]|uniref:flagellar assembly protein A n=1 Tax=Denitratisoma sp. DHT3 TaxID=1981880 RepID=UPI00119832FB|nr:flagellar assembly protein A [Denitratisoma sp. DHT3]QDX81388.1 hypothetical protein B9N43_09115 [Denitratisoma sp. DHT3]
MSTRQFVPGRKTIADLESGEILLPDFAVLREDGLHVTPAALGTGDRFVKFADQVFNAGLRFDELNYPAFQELCTIGAEPPRPTANPSTVRLAAGIKPFPTDRQDIYRSVKIAADGSSAEYIFEPVMIEREETITVQDLADQDGQLPPPRQEHRRHSEKALLQIDEFIAAMWLKGLRYGLDIPAIAAAITADKPDRRDIARWHPPSQGQNATLVEQTDALYRDDTPKRLADGRIDLRAFHNRFPQVTAGTRLLRKQPRVLGQTGWNVRGEPLEPEIPKDCDLDSLAGAGTRVERSSKGEFITAALTGFLNIDTKSNQISVAEKIIDRHGVSLRTTGDLTLSGAEFEEHGEVQERREVKGHHMTFLADVFGQISSDGGRVLLKARLAGGAVRDPGGEIAIEGQATQAVIAAPGGSIRLQSAENCLIIGARVVVAQAVGCNILADTAEIGVSKGSAIACRILALESAAGWRDAETIVTLLLPDLSAKRKEADELADEACALARRRQAAADQCATLQQDPQLIRFLQLRDTMNAGTAKLDPPRQAAWQAMINRMGPVLKQLKSVQDELQALDSRIGEINTRQAQIATECQQAEQSTHCSIVQIAGDTRVRSRRATHADPPGCQVNEKLLRNQLRGNRHDDQALFSGSAGSFHWPEQPPLPDD